MDSFPFSLTQRLASWITGYRSTLLGSGRSFPIELERYIFELALWESLAESWENAAKSSTSTKKIVGRHCGALNLLLVDRRVLSWLEPLVYHEVHLFSPTTLNLFLVSIQSKPRDFFLKNVQKLYFSGAHTHPHPLILQACANVRHLGFASSTGAVTNGKGLYPRLMACWFPGPAQNVVLEPSTSASDCRRNFPHPYLTHLSLPLDISFGLTPSALQISLRSLPIPPTVTHLSLTNPVQRPSLSEAIIGFMNPVSNAPPEAVNTDVPPFQNLGHLFPLLTHLALHGLNAASIKTVLRECPHLQVGVVARHPGHLAARPAAAGYNPMMPHEDGSDMPKSDGWLQGSTTLAGNGTSPSDTHEDDKSYHGSGDARLVIGLPPQVPTRDAPSRVDYLPTGVAGYEFWNWADGIVQRRKLASSPAYGSSDWRFATWRTSPRNAL